MFQSVDFLQSGHNYYTKPKAKMDMPDCWKQIVIDSIKEQQLSEINKNSSEPLPSTG